MSEPGAILLAHARRVIDSLPGFTMHPLHAEFHSVSTQGAKHITCAGWVGGWGSFSVLGAGFPYEHR